MPERQDGQHHRGWALTDVEWSPGLTSTTLDTRALLSYGEYVELESQAPGAGPRSPLEQNEEYPDWTGPTLEKLNSLLALPENWDSYGGQSISFENAKYAFQLLNFTMEDTTPPPAVVPTAEGSVQLEWHERGIDLEAEVVSPYRICISYEDHRNPESDWEGELTIDLTRLRDAIHELSRRAPDKKM